MSPVRSVPEDILKLAARVAEYVNTNKLEQTSQIPPWLKKAGFTKANHGDDRGAVISPEWVIKYPRTPDGFTGLECEFDIFASYQGQEQMTYLPYTELVRQGTALAMVQEAVVISPEIFNAHLKQVNAVAKKFKMHDVFYGNVGFRKVGKTWQPVVIDLGEFAVPEGRAKGVEKHTAPPSLNKFVPNESDSAFAEGMKRLGVDPAQFAKATHRKLG